MDLKVVKIEIINLDSPNPSHICMCSKVPISPIQFFGISWSLIMKTKGLDGN